MVSAGEENTHAAQRGGVYRTSFARKRTREKRRYAHAKAAGRGVTAAEHHAIAQAGDSIGSD